MELWSLKGPHIDFCYPLLFNFQFCIFKKFICIISQFQKHKFLKIANRLFADYGKFMRSQSSRDRRNSKSNLAVSHFAFLNKYGHWLPTTTCRIFLHISPSPLFWSSYIQATANLWQQCQFSLLLGVYPRCTSTWDTTTSTILGTEECPPKFEFVLSD